MAVYKVRIQRDGKFDAEDQRVEASSEKEAAEKLYGNTLYKQGPSDQMRAIVQAPAGHAGNPTLFYER
jgi:hypothetical protein